MAMTDFKPDYLADLNAEAWGRAAFIQRVEGVQGSTDKDAAVEALMENHLTVCEELGYRKEALYRASQVHGKEVVEVKSLGAANYTEGVDGLMTRVPGVLLGIYVADCGAIYVMDRKQKGVALLHSGKKGTELNIMAETFGQMQERWGSQAEDLQVVLGPCIRPPHYEIDFAQTIRQQVLELGVPEDQYLDCGICTGERVSDYYSYRIEQGNTGRNLALLGCTG